MMSFRMNWLLIALSLSTNKEIIMHRWVFDRRAGISIIFILYTQSV